jgi:nucleoid-associated protein YgaU
MAQSLDQLQRKYQSVITLAQTSGHLQNVNMVGDKLFVRAEVANQDVKNEIWNAIKAIDPQYGDLTADITINSSMPQPQSQTRAAAAGGSSERTYTVQPGDTLSAIAQKFYGSANAYNKIFQANRDKLTDADHIRPGQELVIPS